MPSPFKIVKGAGKAIERSAAKAAAKKAASAVEKKAVPSLEELQKAGTVPTPGGRVSKTDLSLRGMSQQDAIAKARTEPHLTPDPKTGKIVGAPEQVKGRADVDRIRQEFDIKVGRGAKSADWYKRAQEFVRTYAGPDPKAQDELAANLGLMSPRANPDVNLGRSIGVRNAAITGEPATSGAFPDQLKKFNTQFAEHGGAQLPAGMKVAPYASFLSPNQYDPTTAVNDTWHGTNLGFRMRPDKEAGLKPENLGSTQHSYMDYETMLAVDRANKAKLNGRDDWTAGEIQAAPWVDAKARDLMESNGWNEQRAYDEAHKSYGEYAKKYEFQGTHEDVPGKTSGHLPEIAKGDQGVRDDYSTSAGSFWKGKDGRDVLYAGQGAYVGPTHDMTGRWEGEPNVGQVATPLVQFKSGEGGSRVMDKGSNQLVQGTEAARGYFDVQDAAGGTIPGNPGTVGSQNAYELGGVPFSAENMDWLADRRKDLGDIVHYGGDRGLMTRFYPPEPEPANFGKKANDEILADIQTRFPEATIKPMTQSGTYTDYSDAWRGKGAKPGGDIKQGTDAATELMLSKLTDTQMTRMDTPEARQVVMDKFKRDQELADTKGMTVRQDVQTARKIFAAEGFKGLQAALGKGILPVAAAGVFLNEFSGLHGGQQGPPQGGQT